MFAKSDIATNQRIRCDNAIFKVIFHALQRIESPLFMIDNEVNPSARVVLAQSDYLQSSSGVQGRIAVFFCLGHDDPKGALDNAVEIYMQNYEGSYYQLIGIELDNPEMRVIVCNADTMQSEVFTQTEIYSESVAAIEEAQKTDPSSRFVDVTLQQARYNSENMLNRHIAILKYPGPSDPYKILDAAVAIFYEKQEGYHELIEASQSNPWMRVLLSEINDLRQERFDINLHRAINELE